MKTLSEKLSIKFNLVLISIGFVFLFTAFNSMANLQSSLNKVIGDQSNRFSIRSPKSSSDNLFSKTICTFLRKTASAQIPWLPYMRHWCFHACFYHRSSSKSYPPNGRWYYPCCAIHFISPLNFIQNTLLSFRVQ